MCECCNSHKRPINEIIAVTGKGGTGKTTLVSLMTRILRSKGFSVLAVDADPAVSLTYALGCTPVKTIADLRTKMIEDPEEKRRIKDIPMEEVIAGEAVMTFNGYSLLVMGKSEGPGCFCKINDLLRYGISTLSKQYDFTLVDCEAGVEQINRRVLDTITRLFMVTDTTAKGLRTASSIRGIAGEYGIQGDYTKGVILNRIRGTEIDEMVKKANGLGIEILGFMPEDPCVTEHDLLDIPITDIPDNSPCLKAVRDILEKQGFFNNAHRHEATGTLR
ncbi:MAG: AAA family ATPase [Desulfomonilia bacterium]|jgi:CO dehydrogenase maturation factor